MSDEKAVRSILEYYALIWTSQLRKYRYAGKCAM